MFPAKERRAFKLNPANCFCLKHLARTDSSVVARVSMQLLAMLGMQDANHIPMGMMPLRRVGYLPPWEYYQNNKGWGCAESGWGSTWAFNQLTWWDYNAYFRGPLPELSNWFKIQSRDANITHQQGAVPSSWPRRPRPAACFWDLQVYRWVLWAPRNTLLLPLRNAF